MKDIFEHTILCKNCEKKMHSTLVSKNGFNLRALECKNCHQHLIHPSDKQEYEEFIRLKKKAYEVKMRMVGNSYAVSIPREIVDFMEEHQRMVDNMVRLSFEDAGRLSLAFNTSPDFSDLGYAKQVPDFSEQNARTVSAQEVKVVKNGKTTYHAKKFIDSKHPEKNKTIIKHNREQEEDHD